MTTKKTLVAVSFGTSVQNADSSIVAVEHIYAEMVPGWNFCRAYTSPTIRRILNGRGIRIESLPEVLARLAEEDPNQLVVVQPTHFFYGIEYDKIRDTVQEYSSRFTRILLGKPLASGNDELQRLARIVMDEYLPEEGALVLMGHGTVHYGNMTYPAFQTTIRLAGARNAYVGTVDGWPRIEDVIAQLKEDGHRKVRLVPLMLVAGLHARKDMAGPQPTSWVNLLEADGFEVECIYQGLGELPQVQQIYAEHLKELLNGI